MDKHILLSRITTREKGLRFHAQRLTAEQAGKKLNISTTTDISHRNILRIKLECKNCAELFLKAYQIGLL